MLISRMLMRKNVNNDVSKDSPIRENANKTEDHSVIIRPITIVIIIIIVHGIVIIFTGEIINRKF